MASTNQVGSPNQKALILGTGIGIALGTATTLAASYFLNSLFRARASSSSSSSLSSSSSSPSPSSSSSSSSSSSLSSSSSSASTSASASASASATSASYGPSTVAARFYPMHPSSLDALSPIIVPATTFRMKNAEHGARLSSRLLGPLVDDDGYLYARWGSPTPQLAASMIAGLEGIHNADDAQAGVGTHLAASGMAAITAVFVTLLSQGGHMVAPRAAYGGVSELVASVLSRFGVQVTFVDGTSIDAYEAAILPTTKLLYAETVCNPTLRLTDIEALGLLAHRRKLHCVVDGTFSTPYHTRCLDYIGVTVSIHAATKYLAGHSDVMCGAVSSRDANFLKALGQVLKLLGPNLSSFDAFLLARGIKTFNVRMQRHAENALRVATFLETQPKVSKVFYPGLPSHPDHSLARRLLQSGSSGMVSFEVVGGLAGGAQFVESLKLINLAVSLGSTESLICHSASTTHTMVPRERRLEAGITDGLIRLSVGLEDVTDICNDIKQALDKMQIDAQ